VQTLKAQGKGIKPIMRELGLAKETVRRFYRAANVDELLAKPPAGRRSKLDEFKPHLHRRWNEGCTTVRTLVDEYPGPGLPRQLRNREHLPASLPCTRRGSTCRTTGAEGPPPHLLDAAPPRRYRQRRLHRFDRGLKSDYDAVRNGLTLPHSSGAGEGNVNRIKMIKRQMYGRANFDLLRKRTLHATLNRPGMAGDS